MAPKTTFMVQTSKVVRERLVPGDPEFTATANGALKKAEALAARIPGAAALKIVADDETGELAGVTILGPWCDVREDFAESPEGG